MNVSSLSEPVYVTQICISNLRPSKNQQHLYEAVFFYCKAVHRTVFNASVITSEIFFHVADLAATLCVRETFFAHVIKCQIDSSIADSNTKPQAEMKTVLTEDFGVEHIKMRIRMQSGNVNGSPLLLWIRHQWLQSSFHRIVWSNNIALIH